MNVLHFTNHLTVCFKNPKMFLPLIKQFHIQEMILRKTQNSNKNKSLSIHIRRICNGSPLTHKLLKRAGKVFIMQALNHGNKQCQLTLVKMNFNEPHSKWSKEALRELLCTYDW